MTFILSWLFAAVAITVGFHLLLNAPWLLALALVVPFVLR